MDFLIEIICIALAYRIYPPAIIVGEQVITKNAINRFNRPVEGKIRVRKETYGLTIKSMEGI